MEILTLPLGQLETNSYLILPDNSDSAVLVDAPFGAASAIPSILEKHGRKLAAILLTHGHWDHIWDTAALAESTGAKIYAGEEGSQLVENPKFQLQYFSLGDFAGAKIDVFPKDGMELEIAGMKIKCFEAPGALSRKHNLFCERFRRPRSPFCRRRDFCRQHRPYRSMGRKLCRLGEVY